MYSYYSIIHEYNSNIIVYEHLRICRSSRSTYMIQFPGIAERLLQPSISFHKNLDQHLAHNKC